MSAVKNADYVLSALPLSPELLSELFGAESDLLSEDFSAPSLFGASVFELADGFA